MARGLLLTACVGTANAFDCSSFDCTCQGFVDWYGAEVGKTWGCAPGDAQAWSKAQDCDSECHDKGTGCKPASSEHAGCGAPIEKKEVTVGGFTCDGIQTATVYYPSDSSKTYPLLSFAHGWTEGGKNVAVNYKDVIEYVAAHGYVVIAEHSGSTRLCYPEEKHDQLHALDFIKDTPEFAKRVDWNAKVGVYGHSMGGAASGLNAADADAISKYNLGAAVCLHPAQGGQGAASLLPTFFATGTSDTIVPPGGVEAMYNLATGPKVFASMKGANHFECQTKENGLANPHGWDGYTLHWFNCHIKGVQGDCEAAFDICQGAPETEKAIAKCYVDKDAESMTV